MNLTLRQAIILRVQDKSNEELTDIISDSLDAEEQVLPGLGVLFEIIWRHSEESERNHMVETLKSHLN